MSNPNYSTLYPKVKYKIYYERLLDINLTKANWKIVASLNLNKNISNATYFRNMVGKIQSSFLSEWPWQCTDILRYWGNLEKEIDDILELYRDFQDQLLVIFDV